MERKDTGTSQQKEKPSRGARLIVGAASVIETIFTLRDKIYRTRHKKEYARYEQECAWFNDVSEISNKINDSLQTLVQAADQAGEVTVEKSRSFEGPGAETTSKTYSFGRLLPDSPLLSYQLLDHKMYEYDALSRTESRSILHLKDGAAYFDIMPDTIRRVTSTRPFSVIKPGEAVQVPLYQTYGSLDELRKLQEILQQSLPPKQ